MKKKILVILLGVLVCASLVACEVTENPEEIIAGAKAGISLPAAVTENLNLPTAVGDVAISWVSDKPAVISNTGVVTRPDYTAGDAAVKLTATFTYKEISGSKEFNVTVTKLPVTTSAELAAALQNEDEEVFIKNGTYTLTSTASAGVTDVWNSKTIIGESKDGVIINISGPAVSSQTSLLFRNSVVLKNLTINASNTEDKHAVKISTVDPITLIDNVNLENVTIKGAKGLNLHGVKNAVLKNVNIDVESTKGCVAVAVAWSTVEIKDSTISNGTWGSIGLNYSASNPAAYGGFSTVKIENTSISSIVYGNTGAPGDKVEGLDGWTYTVDEEKDVFAYSKPA